MQKEHQSQAGLTDEALSAEVARTNFPLTERGGFLIRRMNQIWSAHIQKCFKDGGYDITSVQFAALDIVVAHGGLDQTDLALRIGYDRATVGGVISRLERMGFVSREPDPTDRRARILLATDSGRAAAVHLGRIARDADAEMTVTLDNVSREALFAILQKLTEAGNALGVAPPFKASGRAETQTENLRPRLQEQKQE